MENIDKYDSFGLPDLLYFNNGQAVANAADWRRRRDELRKILLDNVYGQMPPAPTQPIVAEELHIHQPDHFDGYRHAIYRLSLGEKDPIRFNIDLIIPDAKGPKPVILNGDACWLYFTHEIIRDIISRGNILVRFNRTEIVPDDHKGVHNHAIHRMYPGLDFGALSAWAWGYHRCVDFLKTLDDVDTSKIAVFGHSRGGKTSLLAGATDERIALVGSNASGCGGSGCFRYPGKGSERIADIIDAYWYWFNDKFKQFIGKDESMEFDHHALKALVAPRPLLETGSTGDLWANPSGTRRTNDAAKRIYKFLNAEGKVGISYRTGPHDFVRDDWEVFLDFVDLHFRGRSSTRTFDDNPFA